MKTINELKIMMMLLLATLGGCVQEEHTKTVTFLVDMNDVENVDNVGIKGQFTNPPWGITVSMTDQNDDGICEVKLSDKTAQNSVEFKFVNQNDTYELRDKSNRVLRFKYEPETITYEAVFDRKDGKQRTH